MQKLKRECTYTAPSAFKHLGLPDMSRMPAMSAMCAYCGDKREGGYLLQHSGKLIARS
jgi:hypothetical protein